MSFGSRSLPAPTPEEWERWERIKQMGICAATGKRCWVELHHLLTAGGLRIGHRYTVGLAHSVHQQVKTREFKRQWPNQELLNRQDQMLGIPLVQIPARRQRRKASATLPGLKTVPRPQEKR